jgi:hypothetical protein
MDLSQSHQGWVQVQGEACLVAGNERVVVFAHTCLGYCTNVARASRRKLQRCHWGKRHKETGRRQMDHMVTWNVKVMSLASLEALKLSPGAVGGARGC